MTHAYYNEHDPHAAEWLRNLMAAGLITEGVVDERSICDVQAADLAGFQRCHFFAGIGGWDAALQLAGWPDDRPVWTGSCPCQPFSAAGKRKGTKDERHLWPEFFRLIRECRPSVVFGEQVASKDALSWLDGVFTDMEGADYACGAADLCSAGVGAPHIRQRLFWVANADHDRWSKGRRDLAATERDGAVGNGAVHGMAEPDGRRQHRRQNSDEPCIPQQHYEAQTGGFGDRLADTPDARSQRRVQEPHKKRTGYDPCRSANRLEHSASNGRNARGTEPDRRGVASGCGGGNFWSRYELITDRNGKTRRSEPGLECLVDGLPFRLADGRTREGVSRAKVLKGFGNAIVPQVAAEFITAYMEARK